MNKCVQHILIIIFCTAVFANANAQDSAAVVPPVNVQDTIYSTDTSNSYQFKEISGIDRVHTRSVSPTDLNKLKSDQDYWYVNQSPPREKRETAPPDVNGKGRKENEPSRGLFHILWLNVVFWIILIIGFIALLLWFLKTSNIRLFRKTEKQKEEQSEEQPAENIFEMNFERELKKSIDAKEYRMAVRLLYLRTLRDLSHRNLISYTHEKTNSDYLLQLAGTNYYKNFFKLTRSFDYTWYGQFELSQDSFAMIQSDFAAFKQQLS